MSRIVCAVLAAGRSSRLGHPKQLLSVAGRPLVRHVLEQACATRCEQVAVVLGAERAAVAAAVADLSVTALENEAWESGLASSLHVAVRWARSVGADALLVCVCDQPHVDRAHLDGLCASYVRTQRPVASAYAGTLGVPALFGSDAFERLLALSGDRGAGSLLRSDPRVLAVDWPAGQIDLDTPEDVARLGGRLTGSAHPR